MHCTLQPIKMPPKTSGKAAAKSGKAAKAVTKGDKKKKKGKRKESYAIYIYKVGDDAYFFVALTNFPFAGLEASASRHWGLFEGDVHHELLCQRLVREDCSRG